MKPFKWFFNEYHSLWCKRRDLLASADPTWVEIEARRHVDGRGSIIFLSEEHNLGTKEWEYQEAVEDSYLPHTWVHKINLLMQSHGPRAIKRSIKQFYQRGRRGWSDGDWWNLYTYLEEVIPPMLEKLAGKHHSVPTCYLEQVNDDVDEASKIWSIQLREVARKIRDASKDDCDHDDGKCIPNVYCAVAGEELKEAVAWLGEHWGSLWD